ncbi:hypothetical protein BMR05_15630 [Methylococcaceae bacterium HT4]|nr:hypothetical protein BMR10_17425 [Methylococcaceae bacterium CS4]TXL12362.1 hypothetical protein BMR05_15630 [Methylococcaceae bacterium HT4]TXL20008.1 hypothetical protein BMR06_07140 [Methylococcaceae bacterium HT5]
MKLTNFIHQKNYRFTLFFKNGQNKEVDLKGLIEKNVSLNDIETAQINYEWGCLEFNGGRVDIEPKNLYQYACQNSEQNKVA